MRRTSTAQTSRDGLFGASFLCLLVLGLLVPGLLAAGCTERGPLAPPTLEPLEITVGQRWLRDRAGRVVLLRGATYRAAEIGADIGSFRGPAEAALLSMERLGMNLLRLPLSWRAIEPQPGRLTTRELIKRIDPLVRMAAAHGLAVVLSLRPWPSGPCDDGDPVIPGWVCRAIAEAPDPSCAFWQAKADDGNSLRWHYAGVWAFIAQRYAQDARVVGFEVLDEPSAGGCFAAIPFVSGQLGPYYRVLDRAIRKTGATQALLIEPPASPRSDPVRLPSLPSPVIYSPHLWTQRFGPPTSLPDGGLRQAYGEALSAAARLGAPLLVGEYGGDEPPSPGNGVRGTSAAFALRSLIELDLRLVGGAYYALQPWRDDSARIDFAGLEPVLAHPFARRIAGIPLEMTFSPRTLELRLHFSDDPAHHPKDPTEIFVPEGLYPGGVDVELTPPGRWHLDPQTQRLLVYRGAGSEHRVRVRPRSEPAGPN